ncbi:tail fiber domain-containing protein [Candidatus Dependentiae bacterium]|nr:tail fiber domain-containing protein [Candidatus Dependentiae bacterium]
MQLTTKPSIIFLTLASLIFLPWKAATPKKAVAAKKTTPSRNTLFNQTLGVNAVRRLNISPGAVDSIRLNNQAVTATKIAPGAVQSTAIAKGAVGPNQLASSVQFVFNKTASNTPNNIVLRDSNGNFAAGTITANGIALNGNLTCTGTASIDNAVFMNGIVGNSVNILSYTPVFIDTSTGQLGTVASSSRYKNDIKSLPTMKAELMELKPVSFTYKNDPHNIPQYGLIAEDVAKALPALVVYNKNNQPETVAYHLLPTLLLNEYQEHENRLIKIESKTTELDEQQAKITELINELCQFINK